MDYIGGATRNTPFMARAQVLGTVVGLVVLLLLSFPGSSGSGASAPSLSSHLSVGTHPQLVGAGDPNPFSTGMPAAVAIGAPNLSGVWNSAVNGSAFGGYPEYATLAPNGGLWVTDFGANRVLGFEPPFTTGEAASFVLGQSSFNGTAAGTSATNLKEPGASTFDAQGDLWVSDFGNNRILEFVPPFSDGMAASLVLGQSTFAGNASGVSATNLSAPVGLSFDGHGDLWAADRSNNRVVEFVPPFASGMDASVVLGQSNLTTSYPGLSQTNFSEPLDVAASGNTLWVADAANGRVLAFPLPAVSGEDAVNVIGQANYTSRNAALPAGLESPTSVSVDAQGNLWVSDLDENRVLEYAPPIFGDPLPTIVIGQDSLLGHRSGLGATNLSAPFGAAVSPAGDLWVTDPGNNRLLEFIPTTYGVSLAETGLPAGASWSASVQGQTESGVGRLTFSPEVNGTYMAQVTVVPGYSANPSFVPLEVNGSAVQLNVQFTPIPPWAYSNGMPASIVLGQPNFQSAVGSASPSNASYLGSGNYAAAFDTHGDLWVTDGENNRILEYTPPFSNGKAAALVLGQPNFTSSGAGSNATSLNFPDGLAFDASGNLWVADGSNDRVLEYTAPFTTGMAATLVVGQSNMTGTEGGYGPSNLSDPAGLTVYNGSLWVADYGNNRVLEYPLPTSDGPSAVLAVGQANLTGNAPGRTAVNLSRPAWIAFDSQGNAWIADDGNDRALQFIAPFSTGEAATVVLGQANFTSGGNVLPNNLQNDNGIAVDTHGNVWVADSGNNRVVEYAGPTFTDNQTPSTVLGQGNLTSDAANLGPSGEDYPTAVFQDPHQNIWVLDSGNSRLLGYIPTQYTLNFTANGLPAGTPWSVTVNGTTYAGTGPSISVPEQNGSYTWTVPSSSGYTFAPAAGSSTVNGAPVSIHLTANPPVAYTVTFTPMGLSSSTPWSVVFGGITHTGTAGGPISFSEPNGSYSYTVGTVPGYSVATGGSGTALVAGQGLNFNVAFTSTGSTTSGNGGGPTTTLLILVFVVVLVVVAVAVLLVRRGKGKSPTVVEVPPHVATPPPPPPAGGGPPPGAMS
jgi:sugar lactone lactonase YvrE